MSYNYVYNHDDIVTPRASVGMQTVMLKAPEILENVILRYRFSFFSQKNQKIRFFAKKSKFCFFSRFFRFFSQKKTFFLHIKILQWGFH